MLKPETTITELLDIFPDEGRHTWLAHMFCTHAFISRLCTHGQPWRTVAVGAHMPFHGRWIARFADMLNVSSAQQLFSKLGYKGAPELFSMWTCLLLDRPMSIKHMPAGLLLHERH